MENYKDCKDLFSTCYILFWIVMVETIIVIYCGAAMKKLRRAEVFEI